MLLVSLVPDAGKPDQLRLSPVGAIGGSLILTGMALRLATYRYLGTFFKYEASIQKDHRLVTSGPYAVVRHPSYTALMISHMGWILWNCSEGSWFRELRLWNTPVGAVIFVSYFLGVLCAQLHFLLRRMKSEDEALRQRFKSQWEGWAQAVPYSVVPGVY